MRGGLIDLGSNSFRLLVADAAALIVERSHHLGLARSVSEYGSLTHHDLQQATLIARELLRCAQDHGCDHIGMVATEAFRLASNGAAAVNHISQELGHPIRLLSTAEETTLAFQASAAALPHLDHFTMLDLGGGSLGVASGNARAPRPEHHLAFRLGVHLLAPRTLDGDILTTSSRVRLEHHIATELQPLTRTLQGTDDRPIVLVGGSARALAQVVHTARRAQVSDTVHGLEVDCTDLGHLIGRLSDLPTATRLAVPGMKPRRAETLPLAATILRQVLRSLGTERAVVSCAGLREGGILQLHHHQRRAA
ncbi:MAG: hypothetical protein P8N02_00745 [Actinomycetota bacterium]|jgi:exopolyphosphatase / guanosine-5'-triphosphate,3'-diphosphate pyrophosphatase|nr:hypothetical protein [Actinomycetota bacterium]